MMEMTIEALERLMNSYHGQHSNWMALEVTLPDAPGTEYIIDPRENFKPKLDYIKKTYTNELVHKHVPAIKIVRFGFAPTFAELQDELFIEG